MTGAGKCRSCQKPVRWAWWKTSGRAVPLDPKPVRGGNVWIEGVGANTVAHYIPRGKAMPDSVQTFVTHFTTCANADKHRKPRAR